MVGYLDRCVNSVIDLAKLHAQRLRIYGVSNRHRTAATRSLTVQAFIRDLLPAFADGRIKPLIDQIYSQSVTYLNEFGRSPLYEGDYLALPIPGRSFAVAVSDVWVCVATGLQLEELRVTFVQ